MTREMICISCPMGCRLTVEYEGDTVQSVTGNTCKRGEVYAQNEIKDPRRVVTSIMRVKGKRSPVSVRTSGAIPKGSIYDCLLSIKDALAPSDVKSGDVLIPHVAGTEFDVVATRDAYAD